MAQSAKLLIRGFKSHPHLQIIFDQIGRNTKVDLDKSIGSCIIHLSIEKTVGQLRVGSVAKIQQENA